MGEQGIREPLLLNPGIEPSLLFSSVMATDRNASPPATSPEDNALWVTHTILRSLFIFCYLVPRCITNILRFRFRSFLDILHEAPLFAHRKPARVIGSVFYCILLASSIPNGSFRNMLWWFLLNSNFALIMVLIVFLLVGSILGRLCCFRHWSSVDISSRARTHLSRAL